MPPILDKLAKGFCLTGKIDDDVPAFLVHHNCPKTAAHCADVATEARRVAMLAGANPNKAETAGWLHDISAVYSSAERADIARQLGIDVLPKEDIFPMIIHQKLSVVLAREIFGVADTAILSAIGCHTTLKQNASLLDKVVFVADKTAWDQTGEPPYIAELREALEQSVDHAALVYLQYLWDKRDTLRVIHPWMRDAYLQLSSQLADS